APSTGPLPRSAWQLYSDLQDSGFQVALLGGSDNRCWQKQIGMVRTRFRVDGALSFDKYLDAIKRGRTVVVAGARDAAGKDDWADLEIEWHSGFSPSGSAAIGDTYHVGDDEDHHTFRLRAHLLRPGPVQILWNGKVWFETQAAAGPLNITWPSTTLENMPSGWVTVRTPRAQTSPIYVIVHSRAIWDPFSGSLPQFRPDPQAPCRMARHVFQLLGGTPPNPPHGSLWWQIRERYNAALTEYQRRAGGPALCNPAVQTNPPPPTPPPNDESAEYPNTFPGLPLPPDTFTKRITGRIGHPGDQDHFFVATSCPPNTTHMRARVTLRTLVKANQPPSAISFCWSDGPTRCRVGAITSFRDEDTPPGGGITINVPLDVACASAGQPFRLDMMVTGGSSDIYSLFYSVEGTN
ncbi:MAG: hypothetical protein MJD61_10745, partial [Proteobacteria bacterium]|nr:hypothetical protein [Pseudomonadota bacterium]